MRLYTYRPNTDCSGFRDALAFLHGWLIEPEICVDEDGEHFFEFDLPDDWCEVCTSEFLQELGVDDEQGGEQNEGCVLADGVTAGRSPAFDFPRVGHLFLARKRSGRTT